MLSLIEGYDNITRVIIDHGRRNGREIKKLLGWEFFIPPIV